MELLKSIGPALGILASVVTILGAPLMVSHYLTLGSTEGESLKGHWYATWVPVIHEEEAWLEQTVSIGLDSPKWVIDWPWILPKSQRHFKIETNLGSTKPPFIDSRWQWTGKLTLEKVTAGAGGGLHLVGAWENRTNSASGFLVLTIDRDHNEMVGAFYSSLDTKLGNKYMTPIILTKDASRLPELCQRVLEKMRNLPERPDSQ